MRTLIIIIVILVIGAVAYNSFKNVKDDADERDTSVEEEFAEVSDESETAGNGFETSGLLLPASSRVITKTNGINHSIPLDEIIGGGPKKDGIPSIDNPKFIGVNEASANIDDDELGLALSIGETNRFYPYQILVFHELVNDTLENEPVLVTYCPLCATGIVFERRVNGEEVEFGVSGFLWQSNLLMYDRTSPSDKGQSTILGGFLGATLDDFDAGKQSLWSQVLGEAVWGKWTGSRLSIISSDTVTFGEWSGNNIDGEVLSRDTGVSRSYGSDPYGGNTPILGAEFSDGRLGAKDFVLGIEINGQYKAYLADSIEKGTTSDNFAGLTITIERNELGQIRMFTGSERTPLAYIGGFWFSWVAVHPESKVFK